MTTSEFESKIGRIPRVKLVDVPTPVRPLERLSRHLGAQVWLKDDSRTSEIYGGNKPRKFEFLIGDALRKGSKELVTVGGTGTHHGIACARFGRKFGLRCSLFLFRQFETPHSRENYRILLSESDDVTVYSSPVIAFLMALSHTALKRESYFVPPGGSSPLGTMGYVLAGIELCEQIEKGDLPEPEAVFLPAGSLGTACGLSLGFSIAGIRSQVVGVRVVDRYVVNDTVFYIGLYRTARLLHLHGIHVKVRRNWKIEHGFFGGEYGRPTPEGEKAVSLFYELEGILLDPVYTGKAASALVSLAREGKFKGPILFWNTYAGK